MATKSGSKSSTSDHQPSILRRRVQTPPAETLPEEIIEEILLKLPVRTLLKFRCVSKSWCSLISDKHFIEAHLKASRKDTNFTRHWIFSTCLTPSPCGRLQHCPLPSLFRGLGTDALEVDFPNQIPRRTVFVVGSCNGLLCIVNDEYHIFLWNPSTGKDKKLPDVDDRMKSIRKYGFGFDEFNDDYKVLVAYFDLCNDGSYESIVKIYSLRSNPWKRIKVFEGGLLLGDTGKFVCGNLHWIRINGSNPRWDIFSFGLGSEICGNVAPPDYVESDFTLSLGMLGGCLCVVSDSSKTGVGIWVLREYGVSESWAKMATVPYYHVSLSGPSIPKPLCIGPKGEILLLTGSTILIYSPNDNCIRRSEIRNFGAFFEMHVYYESLVSLV